MHKLVLSMFTAAFLTGLSAAHADGLVKVQQTIFGMDCAPCSYGMQKNLGKLPGVTKVDVSLQQGVATIEFGPDSAATLAAIHAVVLNGGFTADKTLVTVQGTVTVDAGGKVVLTDGTAERYSLSGLTAAQSAALKSGAKLQVSGSVQAPAGDLPVVLDVTDVKAI